MIDVELELLKRNDDCRLVLAAYQDREIKLSESDSEADRWLLRLNHVEEIEPDQLSAIHGKLIALEFLKFQLANRKDGVRYQITSSGRKMLEQLTPDTHADSEDVSLSQDGEELAQSA